MTSVTEQAMELTAEQKLELIAVLWDSMAEHPADIPVPDWQLKELERRIEAQKKDPQPGQVWDEVKCEIRHGKK